MSSMRDSLEVAEAARETEWKHPSFASGIFNGSLDMNLILPFPNGALDTSPEDAAFLARVHDFLEKNVDGDKHDREGKVAPEVLDGLKKLGCFGIKIPKEYGGLGLGQITYNRVVAMVATKCASTAVWLSAHQSIGVPQPLKMFGTPEQKKAFLPRLAAGAVSAFALTEPDVGSDPARMKTTATLTSDGTAYLINGEKLWCTNGPDAELLIVMARTPSIMKDGKERPQITAFIVDRNPPGQPAPAGGHAAPSREGEALAGFSVKHRCEFMGIRAISNGLLKFENVRVPKENILLGEGKGLKLALATLNTGRLTLPAACAGAARQALAYARRWGKERVQWGHPIGEHDSVAGTLAWMAARVFAMDAVTDYAAALSDRGGADIRLEAAIAKMFVSEQAWQVADDAVQIRGGRGYETAKSLAGRGEHPWPLERILRDLRINRIIEGSTEIMHLFIAREALDPHMKAAGALTNPRSSLGAKAASFGSAGLHYAWWFPTRFIASPLTELADLPEELRDHALYVEDSARELSRRIFYALVRYGPTLERRQRVLFRFVDVGAWLFAMIASISRAAAMEKRAGTVDGTSTSASPVTDSADKNAVPLAALFCRRARLAIDGVYRESAGQSDEDDRHIAKGLLEGEYAWLESDAFV